jgi:hypothetical protein
MCPAPWQRPRACSYGCTWVNTHFMLVNEMPHGGLKQSGYGKDMSHYALEDYTAVRHVMIAHAERPTPDPGTGLTVPGRMLQSRWKVAGNRGTLKPETSMAHPHFVITIACADQPGIAPVVQRSSSWSRSSTTPCCTCSTRSGSAG